MEISLTTINGRWKYLTLVSFLFCTLFMFFLTKHNHVSTLFIPVEYLRQQQHNRTDELLDVLASSSTEGNNGIVPVVSLQNREKQQGEEKKRVKRCDINKGKWVYKQDSKPSYGSKDCPFLEEKMNCRGNGRPDFEYENLVWVPNNCSLVEFNGTYMLERLRGKRMVIVGDSMNRNQWESLACLLYKYVSPSRVESIYQKVFIAKDYDFTLEFDFIPILVNYDQNHKSGGKVLQLDKISVTSKSWINADIMLFNTGHWWVHQGKFKRWDLFEHEGNLIEDMRIEAAFHIGMNSWAKWIDQNVNPTKTTVLFRSISPPHNGNFWCYNVTTPIMDESYVVPFPQSMVEIIKTTISAMQTPVRYLNVTKLSQYRRDAHPGVYRNGKWKVMTQKYKRLIRSFADCSHWCLPGVPDTWNRVLYASIFSDGVNFYEDSDSFV